MNNFLQAMRPSYLIFFKTLIHYICEKLSSNIHLQSVPKVSPPAVSSSLSREAGNVLDKIQAELAETKRREDELRRQRRHMFRSQPDLSKVETVLEDGDNHEEIYSASDVRLFVQE